MSVPDARDHRERRCIRIGGWRFAGAIQSERRSAERRRPESAGGPRHCLCAGRRHRRCAFFERQHDSRILAFQRVQPKAEAACMSGPRTGCCMRLDWAFRSLRLAALLCVAAGLAPAQSFTSIFDGKTLHGWDGDPAYWRVENGAIVGRNQSRRHAEAKHLSDLARRLARRTSNCEAEYRLTGGNSGIQYRSSELARHPLGHARLPGRH